MTRLGLRSAFESVGAWSAAHVAAQQAALLSEQRRAWRRLSSGSSVLTAAAETRAGATPFERVLEMGRVSLRRYRGAQPARQRVPVLICYALINRPYILDLMPDKSVVQQYLEGGFDVYLVDWGTPTDADRGLTLADYVKTLLGRAVDFILDEHGCEALHLIGYCMGGTMATLFTALRPGPVKTLTLLAAPIDFSGRESLLNVWADRRHFDVDAFIDAHGNCPAAFLQSCFLYTRPVQNLVEKVLGFCDQMDDPRFLQNFFAMERWVNDNIPVAGETFREFVKKLYQENQLVRGQFHLGGQRVELARISCPLLLLTAESDHLVHPSSTLQLREHVGSLDVEAMMIEAGHVGLVVSSKAHRSFWPAAVRWLAVRTPRDVSVGGGHRVIIHEE